MNSHLLGNRKGGYSMKRLIALLAAMLLLGGCAVDVPQEESKVGSFSYAADCSQYENETEGIKREDFVNIAQTVVETPDHAVTLAKNECVVKYNTIKVDFDSEAGVYRVHFSVKDALGGGQTVYIDQNGVTQWTVAGE